MFASLAGEENIMKRALSTSALLLGLAALPIAAQTTTPSDRAADPTRSGAVTRVDTEHGDDDDFNLGWLGLLGLAGLAGIRRHKHVARDIHTDTHTNRPADRY
jgi:MYXO-CTERM domain-containing protein